ncbi:hypothetical protein L5F25_07965 [Aliarcobacter butzleri]|uniref:hypothetical protein n=1 Tax=Aliarcobacter butzleri TaxID=28197 RepID=UPI001EDB6B79|nr:hypothetical protein [Aliarcobacter butzleri]MCG3708933.1 hypothetical protein [Aliarcobacter butzleri]
MTSPIQPDKTYGVLHTESFFSFLGFAKKIGSNETQKIDVYLDDKLIDTIEANKFIEKIDDMYDVENQAFSYNLPTEYIGKKATISFKNHDSQDELLNSPYTLIDKNHESFNEARFIHSLNEPISEDLKNMYKSNSVGFLATKENLEDEEFMGYIKELMVRFPDVEFKGFYFNKNEELNIKNTIPLAQRIIPLSIRDVLKNIELFIFHINDYKSYIPFIINIGSRSDLTHRVYFVNDWYNSNLKFSDFNDGKDPYNFNHFLYDYTIEEVEKSNNNNATLYFSKLLKIAKNNKYEINQNDQINDWYYFKRIDLLLNSLKVKEFLNKTFKVYI